ncbi:MAG: ATP-binding protein [Suipraeoptans sp.]
MNKRTLKLTAFCSLLTFIFMLLTMLIVVIITMCLYRFDIIRETSNPDFPLFALGVTSIIIGTIIGRIGSKRMIAPLVKISEATKEIANGNYKVDISVNSAAREVNIIAENFKDMAEELSIKETVHNDFINNVSHEFKTPLSAIEGYVTLLQNKNLSEEKRILYTNKILNNTRRLSTLTGNILMLSQLENRDEDIEMERYSLDEQIRQSLLLLEQKWSEKNIELDLELDLIDYNGNSDLLAILWKNLLENAIKYSKDNSKVHVGLKKENNMIRADVIDNGIGMSEDVAKRIFEKFYQGDTSHSSQGNGLGLALAKRIVNLHGGTIEVVNNEKQGTRFTVMLPIRTA